jgi:hypothetical protein
MGKGMHDGDLDFTIARLGECSIPSRLATGYRPEDVTIPNRFLEFTTSKGRSMAFPSQASRTSTPRPFGLSRLQGRLMTDLQGSRRGDAACMT